MARGRAECKVLSFLGLWVSGVPDLCLSGLDDKFWGCFQSKGDQRWQSYVAAPSLALPIWKEVLDTGYASMARMHRGDSRTGCGWL